MSEQATASAWDEECDALVVGSGAGGVTGAYAAGREGLDTILVEAADVFGGTSAYSGGGMWFPNNAVLKRDGAPDNPEDAATYLHAVVGDRTPRELQDRYLEVGPQLIDYLESAEEFAFFVWPWPDYIGDAPKAHPEGRHIMMQPVKPDVVGELAALVRPTLPTERAGHPAPKTLIGGQALIARHLWAMSKLPQVQLRTNTTCDELIVEDGRVVGAVVEHDGKRSRIRARRGVLLASGGFEHNDAMREKYGVPGTSRDAMGPETNQGRAIQAGMDIGADIDLMDQAWWSPGLTHPTGQSTFSLWFTGGIFVGQDGKRFVDESWAYDRLGRAIIDQVEAGKLTTPYWMIYDNREGDVPPVKSTSIPLAESKEYRDAELWHSADTLEGLAEKIGVPADALVATVTRWNGFVANDRDEDFHRGEEAFDRAFSDGGSPLVAIDQGPFHAAAFGLSDLGTKGGLRTDPEGRVLDEAGAVIPGLYAAGNSMAAMTGYVYPAGGNPIGASMVFSYLAALDMAGAAT